MNRKPDRAARWWLGRPPSVSILTAAAVTAAVMVIPLAYIFIRAAGGGAHVWARLWAGRIPELLWHTIALVGGVTAAALLLAVPLAWLVTRTDVPGHKFWNWLVATPLVMPPYVGAFSYITVLGPRGLLDTALKGAGGGLPFSIYSYWGVTAILALFTYPYIYLLVLSALRNMNSNLEQAARAAGQGPLAVFGRVTLPLLVPAITGGTFLVALYVLADFGAVSMLRYPTFTRAIYLQLIGRYDRSGAAVLSTVLVAITVAVLLGQAWAAGRRRYEQKGGGWQRPPRIALGPWRWPALAFIILVAAAGVALPGALVVYWAILGVGAGAWGAQLAGYTWNTLWVSGLAAMGATVLAVPVAIIKVRHPSPAARWIDGLAQSGYALPGVVVALSLIFVFIRFLPWWYGTAIVLLTAYIVRFLPQSLQAQSAALAQIPPNLHDAAQSAGLSPGRAFLRVTLPLMRPGLLGGWALVFVSTLKELPATLLLRPAGFDTLPVRVWMQASEGFYPEAGPAALLLVLLSLPFLRWLLGDRGGSGAAGPHGPSR